jgi:hypothetical protein
MTVVIGIGDRTRIGTPDAAQHLGITTRELKSLRKAKRIPFYRIGHRTVSYALTDLDAFLAGCRVATAGERRVGSEQSTVASKATLRQSSGQALTSPSEREKSGKAVAA